MDSEHIRNNPLPTRTGHCPRGVANADAILADKDGPVVRIGNASGFYGDRFAAFDEMVRAGVDVITGDYLAELTMLILARQKATDPTTGFARTFLSQLKHSLEALVATDARVVVNAGGMNPSGLAEAINQVVTKTGAELPVAYVDGDDLTDRSQQLGLGQALAANAYLGGFGITSALRAGARIVVTGRVTDAALTTGAAAWYHGWERDDLDALAGAMAAGHVIECGMQATGGNFSFFTEIPDLIRPGFPIAEIATDGSSVITKPVGTGGAVTAETVISQLLYEVAGARYPGPDATLRLDSITVTDLGADRVALSGILGEAPPPTLKVSATELGGFRQEMTVYLTGLDVDAKANLIQAQFHHALNTAGLPMPQQLQWTLARTDHSDATVQEEASARLTLVARDNDPQVVGRKLANIFVEIALGSVPGIFLSSPPKEAEVYGRFRPEFVPQTIPTHRVHYPDGSAEVIVPPERTLRLEPTDLDEHSPATGQGPTITQSSSDATESSVALGRYFGARSGDKGGTINVGVWARSNPGWTWLRQELTPERLRELLPEFRDLPMDRVELAKLRAVNFVIHDALGEGIAFGARFDAQAKGVAEWLRSRHVSLPSDVTEFSGLDDNFTTGFGVSS
ncbi:exopolyphosphatase [Auritidibacter sp. NML100628]|nr:exopolyphosphatase [Auritidibacter sp. NML100628]